MCQKEKAPLLPEMGNPFKSLAFTITNTSRDYSHSGNLIEYGLKCADLNLVFILFELFKLHNHKAGQEFKDVPDRFLIAQRERDSEGSAREKITADKSLESILLIHESSLYQDRYVARHSKQ